MNDQALQVQVDLIGRALGIEMNNVERGTHRLATIAPAVITSLSQLDALAGWFRTLKSANDARRAFDPTEFNQSLARQWTTVVLAARRGGQWKAAITKRAFAGVRQIGLPAFALVASAGAGAGAGDEGASPPMMGHARSASGGHHAAPRPRPAACG